MPQTPGFLSNAIRCQAKKGDRPSGSTSVVLRRLVRSAREWHKALNAKLNDVHSLLHPLASMPDGPAAPDVRRDDDLIKAASTRLKITG